ncbi:MAG: tetratricopeptide repeat protein [Sandaracinaceae bacterium]|nr:tetratricopeptide repeat protein [Sandaracinaceae bacterium]
MASMMAATTEDEIADPLIGATIGGRYEVVGQLGRGGAGVVYEARQRRLGRTVAIKVMRVRGALDATSLKRFKREATAISGLAHPNIIDIYDVDRLPDGRPYLVMPLLAGRDLRTILGERGPLALERVLELLEGPASAIDLMHGRGIVHRDLKPENLVLEALPNGQEVVRIVDFGHAWVMDREARRLTREGLVVGTAAYLSPEAARGETIDGRADVYSLACVVFELLSGRCPFDDRSGTQILIRKTEEDPPTLASFGVVVEDGVEAALARGLARDPSRRHATAGDLIADLSRGAGSPVRRAPTPVGDAPKVIVDPHLRPALRRPRQRQLPTEVVRPLEKKASEPVEVPMLKTRRPLLAAAAVVGALALGLVLWNLGPDEAPAAAAAPAQPVASPAPAPAPIPDAVDPPEEPVEPPVLADAVGIPPRPVVERTPSIVASAPAAPATADAPPASDRVRAERLTRQGTHALTEGLVPQAIQRFGAATLADPDHAPAWRGLGLANQRMGRPAEARRAYTHYLALAPTARDAAAIRARLEALQ